MSDLETRLRTALHEEAGPVVAPPELAGDLAARGARVRGRHRAAVAVAGVAAVAVAVPFLHAITTSTTTMEPVAPSPTVSHSPHRTSAPAPVQQPDAWVAGLPDGGPPSVPYLRGMTYQWSPRPGQVATYPVPDVNTNVFGPVRGGVAVGLMDTPAGHPYFGIATPGVAFRRLGNGTAFGMAASPDGSRVAVGATGTRQIQVYDVATGAKLSSVRAVNARVLSWGPGGVYYETGYLSGNTQLWVWDPTSGGRPSSAVAALNEHGVGLTSDPGCTKLVTQHGVSGCLAVPHSATDQAVSPDGRYVGYLATGPDRSAWVAVLDTSTGRTARLSARLPATAVAGQPHNLVWESGDGLLFVLNTRAHGRPAASMIRCSPTGGCEVALRDVTGPGNDFFPTLALTPPLIY